MIPAAQRLRLFLDLIPANHENIGAEIAQHPDFATTGNWDHKMYSPSRTDAEAILERLAFLEAENVQLLEIAREVRDTALARARAIPGPRAEAIDIHAHHAF